MSNQGSKHQKYHYFWRTASPFSQWHPSTYVLEVDGVNYEYNCAEQGMMHGKALLFGDSAAAQKILQAKKDPREMKKLGRLVHGFNDETWKKHRYDIVYQNSLAKFTQNPHLQEALLNTVGDLVEAAPNDGIWGIGLHERDAKEMDPQKWPGLNLLGKILTRVREEIIQGINETNTASEENGDVDNEKINEGEDADAGASNRKHSDANKARDAIA